MALFGNRSLVVKSVRDKDIRSSGESGEEVDPFLGPRVAAAYSDVAKDLVTHVALTIGGVFIGCKIVERIMR